MISNFNEVKMQLAELSEVINKFKSEAVQLRIVEIVLGDGSFPKRVVEEPEASPMQRQKPRRRKSNVGRSNASKDSDVKIEKAAKKSRPSGQGAVASLSELANGDFFTKPKTISDIVSYCEQNMARRFKPNEFSGKLGRMTRDRVLVRVKNGDNQYEYTKT